MSTMQDIASSPESSPALLSHEIKSPNAFRTISEVADDLSLPQHVLRFWESKFQQIKPLKRGGGRRYYRPEDVTVIHNIKHLLYTEGMTIRGVQKLLRESGSTASLARSMVPEPHVPTTLLTAQPAQQHHQPQPIIQPVQQPQGMSSDKRREIEGVLSELRSMRKILQQSGI